MSIIPRRVVLALAALIALFAAEPAGAQDSTAKIGIAGGTRADRDKVVLGVNRHYGKRQTVSAPLAVIYSAIARPRLGSPTSSYSVSSTRGPSPLALASSIARGAP